MANFIRKSMPTKYDDIVFEIGKQVLYNTSDEALDHIHESLSFYEIVNITKTSFMFVILKYFFLEF